MRKGKERGSPRKHVQCIVNKETRSTDTSLLVNYRVLTSKVYFNFYFYHSSLKIEQREQGFLQFLQNTKNIMLIIVNSEDLRVKKIT